MAPSTSLAAPVPRLEDLCLKTLADNIHLVASLQGLPEELVCCLFDEVIKRGKLTPPVLRLFRETEHELLLMVIQKMNISDWIPPLLPTRSRGWLGDKPRYY